MVQTLQQKIFGGMMTKLIINQSKLASDTLNTFVDLLAWINNHQLVSSNLPQHVPVLGPKSYCPLYSGSWTGLSGGLIDQRDGLTGRCGGLTGLGGDQIGWRGGQTIRLCIE
jgi:hypothetical protein